VNMQGMIAADTHIIHVESFPSAESNDFILLDLLPAFYWTQMRIVWAHTG
jgi:hypothetical protein